MKLYIYEHCPFCTRARMIFGLKAIPVEICIVMEGDAETPIRLVGKKGVPILVRDDGSAMSESMDIVRYVDAQLAPKCLTQPAREEIEAWCRSARSTISNLAIPRMTKSSFAENATEAARQAYREREHAALGNLEALISNTPRLVVEAEELLTKLELIMDNWTTYSETDLVLYSNLRALSIVKNLKFGPKARDFAGRMAALGGVPLLDDRAI